MHERAADVEKIREEMGEDASALAVAIHVMARHRDKYKTLSELSLFKPLPDFSVDAAGRTQMEIELSGHSLVHLHLEPVTPSHNISAREELPH